MHPDPSSTLILRLVVPGNLPSWNEIVDMHHYEHHRYKKALQPVFLSALRMCERGFSMKTIYAKSSTLTYSATLESYLLMLLAKRALKQRSGSSKKVKSRTSR